MSDWNLSVVVIVPENLVVAANKLSCALGYDELPGKTFSVPLSETGDLPITHYGCRTAAKQEFIDIMSAAAEGNLPPEFDYESYGIQLSDIETILQEQILSVRDASDMFNHFNDVIQEHNLSVVSVDK